MKHNKIALNVKNMVAMMRHAEDQEILEKVLDTFYTLYNLGFITDEEWKKFTKTTDRWTFNEDGALVDFETGEPIA